MIVFLVQKFMEEEETRAFNVELTIYRGHRITVGQNSDLELRFKDGSYFDVKVIVKEQKTLSSTKPTYARIETFYEIYEFDKDVKAGRKFYLIDPVSYRTIQP